MSTVCSTMRSEMRSCGMSWIIFPDVSRIRGNWHGNDLLHCVVLHLVLRNELHSFNSFRPHLRNRDVNDRIRSRKITISSIIEMIFEKSALFPAESTSGWTWSCGESWKTDGVHPSLVCPQQRCFDGPARVPLKSSSTLPSFNKLIVL